MTFKAGIVRQFLIPAESFLFIGLFFGALLEFLPAVAVGIVSCLAWGATEGSVISFSAPTTLARAENNMQRAASGIIRRFSSPDTLPTQFDQANAAIRAASPLPRVSGTVDLYPANLMFLLADGMKWDGRPIIVSYAAYTPALAELNAAHLRGNGAPSHIFFAVEPIDGRLPALEDAASWPLLLSNYSIVGFDGTYLHMMRVTQPRKIPLDQSRVAKTTNVGEWIDIPRDGKDVWVRIDMHPTILGRLMLAAFKLPRVWIELKLADGRTVRRRYIPEMGRGGFLLSPYIGSTLDFVALPSGSDNGRYVRRFKIDAPDVGLWSRTMRLSFTPLDIPANHNVRQLVLTQPSSPPSFVSASKIDQVEDCLLDTINGDPVRSLSGDSIVVDDDDVNVIGWTAPSGMKGIGPDETWLALTAENGERRFYRAEATKRPDVLAVFKQPEMKAPGFTAHVDLSGLSGKQTLTIYTTQGQQAFRCPQSAVLKLD